VTERYVARAIPASELEARPVPHFAVSNWAMPNSAAT